MPLIDNIFITEKKDLHIFYIIDTSASMCGEKIEMLNEYMNETILALKELSSTRKLGANIKVVVMEYNNCPRWVAEKGVEAIDDFTWSNLEARGTSRIVPALRELNSKLNVHNFMYSDVGAFLPIIIFVTGGTIVDDLKELESGISELRLNRWFKEATKIAFVLDKDADVNYLTNICGDKDCIFSEIEWRKFKNLLAKIALNCEKLQGCIPMTGTGIGKTVRERIMDYINKDFQEYDESSTIQLDEEDDCWYTS